MNSTLKPELQHSPPLELNTAHQVKDAHSNDSSNLHMSDTTLALSQKVTQAPGKLGKKHSVFKHLPPPYLVLKLLDKQLVPTHIPNKHGWLQHSQHKLKLTAEFVDEFLHVPHIPKRGANKKKCPVNSCSDTKLIVQQQGSKPYCTICSVNNLFQLNLLEGSKVAAYVGSKNAPGYYTPKDGFNDMVVHSYLKYHKMGDGQMIQFVDWPDVDTGIPIVIAKKNYYYYCSTGSSFTLWM